MEIITQLSNALPVVEAWRKLPDFLEQHSPEFYQAAHNDIEHIEKYLHLTNWCELKCDICHNSYKTAVKIDINDHNGEYYLLVVCEQCAHDIVKQFKPSDFERFKQLYESVGIEFVPEKRIEADGSFSVQLNSDGTNKHIDGYGGFFTAIDFDKDGKFIKTGAWE